MVVGRGGVEIGGEMNSEADENEGGGSPRDPAAGRIAAPRDEPEKKNARDVEIAVAVFEVVVVPGVVAGAIEAGGADE